MLVWLLITPESMRSANTWQSLRKVCGVSSKSLLHGVSQQKSSGPQIKSAPRVRGALTQIPPAPFLYGEGEEKVAPEPDQLVSYSGCAPLLACGRSRRNPGLCNEEVRSHIHEVCISWGLGDRSVPKEAASRCFPEGDP